VGEGGEVIHFIYRVSTLNRKKNSFMETRIVFADISIVLIPESGLYWMAMYSNKII